MVKNVVLQATFLLTSSFCFVPTLAAPLFYLFYQLMYTFVLLCTWYIASNKNMYDL